MKWIDKLLPRSLFLRTLLAFVCVIFAAVLMLGVLNDRLIRNYIIRSNYDELFSRAETITGYFAERNSTIRGMTTQRIDEWEALTDARFVYVDTNYRMLTRRNENSGKGQNGIGNNSTADYSSATLQSIDFINAIEKQQLEGVFEGAWVRGVRTFDFAEGEILYVGVPVVDENGSIIGAAMLYREISDVDQINTSYRMLLIFAGLGAVALAVVFSVWLSQRITQPLIRLNGTAKQMLAGKYGARVDVRGRDEIGQLGETLNALSGRIGRLIETLSQERDKLSYILSGISEGLIAVDETGSIIHMNDVARGAIGGDSPTFMHAITRVAAGGSASREVWSAKNGLIFEAVIAPFSSDSGERGGAVALIRDVSEINKLERMRRDYVANISHELRTPLTGIRGMVEPLIDGVLETEQERQDSYRIIYQETLRLERLIGDMLDISRLQSGRISIELEPLNVEGIFDSAIARMRERAASVNVKLCTENMDEACIILGNEDRILQTLIILMDNAISFTPPGGSVTLFLRREPDVLWLGVRDTGSGISEADLPYIWERFYKADKSRMTTGGTGLGLSIAKLTATLMQGEIVVASTVGMGSEFAFSLKRCVQPL